MQYYHILNQPHKIETHNPLSHSGSTPTIPSPSGKGLRLHGCQEVERRMEQSPRVRVFDQCCSVVLVSDSCYIKTNCNTQSNLFYSLGISALPIYGSKAFWVCINSFLIDSDCSLDRKKHSRFWGFLLYLKTTSSSPFFTAELYIFAFLLANSP